jgi:CubicO group peptidase (beta-lactamase class C family)
MNRIFFCLLVFAFAVNNGFSQANYSPEVLEQIKQVENNLAERVIINGKGHNIEERMAHYNVKGLSIAVVHDYKIVWAKGYGWADEKEKRPVTTETLFKPGSISKSLNAVGVLKLAQDNRLDLNTDINQYLKSWKFPYDSLSKGKKITLSYLLSHMAGLSVYGGFTGYDIKDKIPTMPEILDGKTPANSPPVRSMFEPGLQFQYSAGGTMITQLIITDVTQQSYEKYMYDNVLKPLGMTHSYYSALPPDHRRKKNIATGYRADGTEDDNENSRKVYPELSALGLWTTPTELCKYVIETQLASKGKSSKILNQKFAKLQLTPTVDSVAALGFFIDKRGNTKYFQHDALNWNFSGVFYGSVEEGNGIAICMNSPNIGIWNEILNSVAMVYKWKDFYNPVYKNEIAVPESVFEKYTGIYLFENKLARVYEKPDGYHFWAGGTDTKMHFSNEKEFFSQEFASDRSFISDAEGKITGYTRKVGDKEYPAAVKITNADTIHTSIDEIIMFGSHLLENREIDKAINFLNRGLALEPNNIVVSVNLAHSYLFSNEYDKAIKLYSENISKNIAEGYSVKDDIKQSFISFKKKGFDSALMDKVMAELKIEGPEGY